MRNIIQNRQAQVYVKMYRYSKAILRVWGPIMLCIFALPLYAADGYVFTAKTVEGVEMTFKVISETNKACQVGIGTGNSWDVAIDISYSGSITIPSQVNGYSVTSIGHCAFYGCSGLTGTLTIPNSVTYIGHSAFYKCIGLTGSLTIPNSVTSIGSSAFDGCSGLTGSLTIPNSVTSIGRYAFKNCSELNGMLTISNNLTSIEKGTFYGCSGLTGALTIPNSVTSIGEHAFWECSGLNGTLTIPNSVKSIGSWAFGWCSGLTGSLTIPENIRIIEEGSFYGCSGLTGLLTIPNSVTQIRKSSFHYCSGLTGQLIIPNSVTTIGDNAFYWCSGLSGSLTIPSLVTSIGSDAFLNCSGFKGTLTIPNSVITIKEGTFYGCSGLTGPLIIPNSVISIGANAFYNCSGFTGSLIIPNSVTSIGGGAFSGCSGFTGSLTIPNSVISIGYSTFYRCSGLTGSIIIPNSVKSIDGFAFNDCIGIDSVKSKIINPFEIDTSVFSTLYSQKHKILQVPKGTKSKYMEYTEWTCNFIEIIENEEMFDTTYNLIINAIGNGSVFYNNAEIREETQTFTVNEGASATITFAPDTGYRIASVKLDNTNVTSSVVDNKYTISNITKDMTLSVTFEAITHTLIITSSGNGSAYYNNTTVRNKTELFTINEGTSATVTFTPDAGYRIASIKLNDTDVTASVMNSKYTISNIAANTTLAVTFEAIPPTTYTLSVTATGNGSATYNSTEVRSKTLSFTVNEGTSMIITFTPDTGYRIASVKVNGTDVTSSVSNNQYTISNITSNYTIEVEFREAEKYYAVLRCMAGSTLLFAFNDANKYWFYEGDELTLHPSRCYGKDGVYYKTPATTWNGTPVKFPGTWPILKSGGKTYYIATLNYEEDETVAYYSDFERLALPKEDAGDGTGLSQLEGTVNSWYSFRGTLFDRFSGGRGIRLDADSYVWTEPIAKAGTYKVTIYGRNDSNVGAETPYILGLRSAGGNITWFTDLSIPSWGASVTGQSVVENVAIPAGSSLIVKNIDENNLISLDDITLTKQSSDTPVSTFAQTVKVTGNGTVGYNGISIRNSTQVLSMNEGTSATFTITPDANSCIKSVKLNGTDVTSDVINYQYTISNINSDNTLVVEFEAISPTTYTLSITASGNGYVAYDGNTVRGKTSSFTVVKGTNIILTFSPDEGSRLKSVKVNGQDITSTIINDKYIKNVTADINIEVAFEAIPSYSLNIVASGNGNAVYNGTTIRNQSFSFTLQEGSTAVVSLTPDTGYRIKSVKVNNTDRTSQMSNGQITISSIDKDTNVEVSFEEIPPTTYGLTIAAIGNGSVTYDGKTIRSGSSLFTIVEGSYVTVQIAADAGYRLKSVVLSGKDVTADVANNQYTTTKIVANTTLKVEFEAIPSFSLTIKSSAFGSVKYGDAVITNGTETFTVREGAQAVLTFMADGNGRLQRITLNGADITQELKNWQYTISNIGSDQSVEAEYIEDFNKVTFAGVAYTVTSYDEGTVIVASGNYGLTLTVPATFEAKGKTWTVTGIDNDALVNATELAAIIWKPEVQFSGEVSNPNLLLYVKRADYAPSNIQNVVEGNEDEGEALQADNIVLAEAESGNNFYCPIAFTARRISYKHNYSMISGYNVCQGWETLVLPFDVSMIVNAKGTELVPYTSWRQGSSLRPFWLYQMTESGWQAGNGIKANVPYIISIPNNELYQSSYNVAGNIQFIGNNVEVKASDDMTTGRNGNKRFVANYQNKAANSDIYALNVNNLWCHNAEADREGSVFVSESRPVHPFEAYMTIEGSNAPMSIPVFDGTTDVRWLMEDGRNIMSENEWYDLQGRKLQGEPTKQGIYIRNGKKIKK